MQRMVPRIFTGTMTFSQLAHSSSQTMPTNLLLGHPLLASIYSSPFLAIPCCSHTFSGLRFRAPSVFNSSSADSLAPSYFAANITKSKPAAIKVACSEIEEDQPREGDLEDLSIKSRSKQPSAYASLCDWVCHLSAVVGYVVEKEMLRLPTTRNMGIVGRSYMPGFELEDSSNRMERVKHIASKEKANGAVWVQRAKGLIGNRDLPHWFDKRARLKSEVVDKMKDSDQNPKSANC